MSSTISFYRTPIDRAVLKTLTARKNLPGFIQVSGILGFYLLTTGVSLYFYLQGMWIPMVAALYFHSLFSGFLGMESSVHELSHKTPFKSKFINEFFYGLFAFLTWNNPAHFRESHRRHHQNTVFRGKDKEVILEPAPFKAIDVLFWLTFDWEKFLMLMKANVAFFFGRDMPDVFGWDPLFEKDDPRRKKMFAFARFQILGHIALAVLFAYLNLWILIYTVSLSYFFATILARSCEIVQHVGMPSDVPDWRATCHTMKFGPVMSLFYWNMNYHIEHHMYASVPFHQLGKLHEQIKKDCPEPIVGFIPGVRKIWGLMKEQRKDPSWTYSAQLPADAAPMKTS